MSEIDTSVTYRRLRQYARPYWGLIAIGILAMALEATASGATLWLLGPIVDNIFVEHNFSYWLPAGLVLLLMARGLFGLVSDYTIARAGRNVARDLRMQLMAKYLELPGARFDTEPVPSMLTRLGADSEQVAQAAVDSLKVMISNTLGIIATRSLDTQVTGIKDLARSFKEAQVALEVGKVFDTDKTIVSYDNLGIARLIYQLPITLCEAFLREVFKQDSIDSLDSETLFTIQRFFENNLNVSETSRGLFVHRNTLVYRLEKIKKLTGLDLRKFDDAIVFKVALMVKKYLSSDPARY